MDISELFSRPNGVAPREGAASRDERAAAGALADQLSDTCSAHGHPRCLLLTGPAILQAFSDEALQVLRNAGATIEQIPLRPDRVGPEYRPALIELDPARDVQAQGWRAAVEMAVQDWQAESLTRGLGHRIGAFMLTDAPVAQVARHLAQVAIQQRSDQPGQRLLAISDPAAFEGLWRVCSATQRRRLLGPATLWRTLGRWGDWVDHRADVTVAGGNLQREESERRTLGLDNEQWLRLSHVRAINRAWTRAQAEGHIVAARDFDKLPESLLRAHGYGLTDMRDLELFAWHALWAGPDFDRHPSVQAVLSNRPADMRYGRAVADLDDEDWDDIRAGHQPVQTDQQWSRYVSSATR